MKACLSVVAQYLHVQRLSPQLFIHKVYGDIELKSNDF